MATVSWVNSSGGFWTSGSSWSSGSVPSTADSAFVTLPGTYQITVYGFGTVAVNAMTLNAPGASIAIANGETLALGTALMLDAGTVLLSGGIAGGTIDFAGGTLLAEYGGLLNGVTLAGTGALGGAASISIANGLSLATGAVLDLQGAGLQSQNTGTIGGGTILLDGQYYPGASLDSEAGTLSLAANMVVAAGSGFAGTIAGNVTNNGLITIAASEGLTIASIGSGATFWNAGTLALAPGSTLTVDETFRNTGSVIDTGATIVLAGSISQAELAAFVRPSVTVDLAGSLNEAGSVLAIGTSGVADLIVDGTLAGGSLQFGQGAAALGGSGTLAGVTLLGTGSLAATAPGITVSNGLILAGVGGTGAGTLTIGPGPVQFAGPEVISGGTVLLSGGLGGSSSLIAAGGQLTLAASTLVEALPLPAPFFAVPALAGTILNQGRILVPSGGTLAVGSGGTLINAGALTVAAGGVLELQGAVANTGTVSISGSVLVLGSVSPSQLLADRTALNAPLAFAGTLNNAGATLAVGTGSGLGTLTLAAGGTIAGGVVSDAGGGLIAVGGTLSAVTYRGTLQAAGLLDIAGGLSLAAGTLNVLSAGTLALLDAETIDNAAINLAGTLAGTLAIGAHGTLSHASFGGAASTAPPTGTQVTGALANAGTLLASVAGGAIAASSLSNTGSVSVTGGDFLCVGTLFNTGKISVTSGGALAIGTIAANVGSISETNATLNLSGPLALAQLSSITRYGGLVSLEGSLALGGGTLSVGAGTALGQLRNDNRDVIYGGTIVDSGSGLIFVGPLGLGGTLSADTYEGVLNLVPAGSSVTVVNGAIFTGAGGTGQGTINLLGAGSYLGFQGSETLTNILINMGNLYQANTIAVTDVTPAGGAVLTLGASSTIQAWGAQSVIMLGRGLGDGLIDQGVIGVTSANTKMMIEGGTFTSTGQVMVANSSTLGVLADTIGNLSNGTLSGGNWKIIGSSVLDFGVGNAVTALNAPLYLGSPGSELEYFDTGSLQEIMIDQSLRTIASSGNLLIASGRSFGGSNTLGVSGALTLAGGTLAASATILAGANLAGNGVVTGGAIYDSGVILAQGGAMTLNDPVLVGPTGAGGVWINVGATLTLGARETNTLRFVGSSGELILSQPTLLTGSITGFTGSDLIDLVNVGTAGLSVSYASSGNGSGVLTVKAGTVTVTTLNFLGTYVTQNFTLLSDGHGGTLIHDPPVPLTSANLAQSTMSFVASATGLPAADGPSAAPSLMTADIGTLLPTGSGSGGAGGLGTMAPSVVLGAAADTNFPASMALGVPYPAG